MTSTRRQLVALIERGTIPREQVARAVRLSGLHPSGRAWSLFLDRLLLWLGCLALAFAVLFFIAYNWSGMERWLRFGLVEAALVLAVAVYWLVESRGVMAQVALTAATLLLGVLLALFGQVYQTGADPWQLFFVWAVLMLPWVLVARFGVLWVLWLALLNLTILLYFRTWGGAFGIPFGSEASALWVAFLLDSAALAFWELGTRRWSWLSVDWARRLVALGSGVPITLLLMMAIVDGHEATTPAWLAYPLWLAAIYGVYRYWRPDLFMLAGGCLSAIMVTLLFLARQLLWQAEAGGFLILFLAALGLGAAAVFWLKRVHAEMQT
ncbi:MAG: DUF2157 domain-containing protein [Pseudomonadota bacterium]